MSIFVTTFFFSKVTCQGVGVGARGGGGAGEFFSSGNNSLMVIHWHMVTIRH